MTKKIKILSMAFLVAMAFASCSKSKMEEKPETIDGGIISFEIQELIIGSIYIINLDTQEDGKCVATETIFVDVDTFISCIEMTENARHNQFVRFKLDNSARYYVFKEQASMKNVGTPPVYVFSSDQKIITN